MRQIVQTLVDWKPTLLRPVGSGPDLVTTASVSPTILWNSVISDGGTMVHVLFDDEIFSIQIRGGISRYVVELIGGLVAIPDIEVQLPFWLTVNGHLAASNHFSGWALPSRLDIPGRRTATRMINRRTTAYALAHNRPDVVHATFYDARLLDRIGAAKLVITVHDMVPELMPEAVGGLEAGFASAKHLLIRMADGVIAVSATTAVDVAEVAHRPIETITVIHHGISDDMRWKPEFGRGPALPDRFYLCVGQRRAYKNFLAVAPAFAEVMRTDSGLALVCFGGGSLTVEEKAPFEAAGVLSKVITIAGDDRALASVYARAVALVYPSLYEGFGMPILEAMTNQCPVVIPRRGSLPEIADEAALYFNPEQKDATVEILNRLTRDAMLRRRLAEAGARRVACFSWQRSAAQHAALYRKLAS